MGVLAGIATITGLSFLTPGVDINNAIGIYMTILLLSAALGGPLAGALASIIFITIATLFGPPDDMPPRIWFRSNDRIRYEWRHETWRNAEDIHLSRLSPS